MMMRDEDRFQCAERNAGAGELIGDAEAAIEHVGGAVVQIACEVIFRVRPGTGPAAVPSSTSLVPLASVSAACVCWGSARSDRLRGARIRCCG